MSGDMLEHVSLQVKHPETAMAIKITRRDFMSGVAMSTGATLLAPYELFAQSTPAISSANYPPAMTGMRGNHPGSFEVSHALA